MHHIMLDQIGGDNNHNHNNNNNRRDAAQSSENSLVAPGQLQGAKSGRARAGIHTVLYTLFVGALSAYVVFYLTGCDSVVGCSGSDVMLQLRHGGARGGLPSLPSPAAAGSYVVAAVQMERLPSLGNESITAEVRRPSRHYIISCIHSATLLSHTQTYNGLQHWQ